MTATDIERGLIARYAWRVLSREDLPARAVTRVVYWLQRARRFDGHADA